MSPFGKSAEDSSPFFNKKGSNSVVDHVDAVFMKRTLVRDVHNVGHPLVKGRYKDMTLQWRYGDKT